MNRHVLPIVGPAGCGKGTTCGYLEILGATVVTMSTVLGDYAQKQSSARKIIHEYKTVRKENVPDDVVVDAIKWKLRPMFRQQHTGMFALDGFGRGPGQIKQFAEWIEIRNVDYKTKGRPIIKHGYVFLSLDFDETMTRVAKRVEEFRQRGEQPRAEDLGDNPKKRFEEYHRQENLSISVARSVTGNVQIIDLGKHTTLDAAAMIYGTTHEVDSEDIARKLRLRLHVA